MPQAVVAAVIAAAASAATAVYESDVSRKQAHKAADAQKAALAQQQLESKKQASEALQTQEKAKGATASPDVAAQVKAKLAQEQAASGGGLSPGFYTQTLQQQFPGFEGLVNEVVSKETGSGPPAPGNVFSGGG